MDFEAKFHSIYQDYDRYMVIPAVMIILAVAILGINYGTKGEVLTKGLDFTGGTEITYSVNGDFSPTNVETAFANAGRTDAEAVTQVTQNETRLLVRLPPPDMEQEEAERILSEAGIDAEVQGFRSISGAVSGEFFLQAQMAFILAFTIMSLVIFTAFRDIIPALAVILAAAGDILFAAAGMVVLGIPLTLGSLAALLMLIGYSVDTDIVLSTRVLKRNRGSIESRIWSSVKTGVTMSSGGIAGFAILYLVSTTIVGPSELSNIAAVMVVGLLADIPITWFGNAIILKKYVNDELEVPSWN